MKISKNRYLQGFLVVVLLLALVRVIFPSVAEPVDGSFGRERQYGNRFIKRRFNGFGWCSECHFR